MGALVPGWIPAGEPNLVTPLVRDAVPGDVGGESRESRRAKHAMGITRSARSSLNPRERLPGVRSRGLSDDLGVYPAISWVTRRSRRPPRPDETPRTRTIVPGEKGSLKNALSGPAHASRAPPDTALRLAHVEDRTYVMRVQRDRIHPGSRHASSVRQNPPRRDSREPTSHNSSSGDMTNSTPPGAPSGGARTQGVGKVGLGGWLGE